MSRPSVLFVCVKNGGKSQMAAALMRHEAGDTVEVGSAGTHPGRHLNAQSVESLAELGVGVGDEHPKPIDPDLLAATDLVVVVGTDAHVEAPTGPRSGSGTPTSPPNAASRAWSACAWSATTSTPASAT